MHNPVFDDRAKDPNVVHDIYFGKSDGAYGVSFNYGPTWLENRRFCLRTLRDFGFGKRTTETLILEESAFMIEHIR